MTINLSSLEHQFAFQKIVHSPTNNIYKHEVLSRFIDINSHQLINPESVLRKLSLSQALDVFTISQFEKLSKLPLLSNGIRHLSINIEPCQLGNKILLDALVSLKCISGLDISVEVTEREQFSLTSNQVNAACTLDGKGIFICLDDFGIGGSGLLRLLELPVSEVKLDKLIVNKVVHCGKAYNLICSLIEMCQRLNINLVAEGVEDFNTAIILQKLGVHLHQGYYYGKPEILKSIVNCRVGVA